MRDTSIDILRGFAIFFVVLGHSGFPFTYVIYSFHVPLFFILSGYLRHREPKCFADMKLFFIKSLKRLYFPYLAYSIVFILLHNLFINIFFYHPNHPPFSIEGFDSFYPQDYYSFADIIKRILRAFFFGGGEQMGGAMWFLSSMFITSFFFECEYLFVNTFKINKCWISCFNVILFYIGYTMHIKGIHLPYNQESILSIMVFYSVGVIVRNFFDRLSLIEEFKIIHLLIFSVSVITFLLSIQHNVNIGANSYESPFKLLMSSISGFLLLYIISKGCSNYIFFYTIQYIGKNTIVILALHFCAFKLVNFLIVRLFDKPVSYIAAYPILDKDFWPLYTIVGVLLPLFGGYFYDNLKKCLLTWRR